MAEVSGPLRFVRKEVAGLSLALVAVALIVLPRNAAALTSLLAGGALVAALAAVRWRSSSGPPRRVRSALALSAVAVCWLAVRSVFAVDPRVGLIGNIGQHAGALTWLFGLAILGVSLLTSERGDAGRTWRAMGLFGAVLAVAAIADAFGLSVGTGFSPEPSGVVENSLSLGQTLLVCLGASVAWMLGRRRGSETYLAAGSSLVIIAGLVAAQSLAAWVGLVVAPATVAAGVGVSRFREEPIPPKAWAALAAVVLGASVVGAWVLLADGVVGPFEELLASWSNDRFTIWMSAVEQVRQYPLFGAGAEHFSAWVNWDVAEGGAIVTNGTYDPHNIVFAWLLAGGLLGLALGIVAASANVGALAGAARNPATTAAAAGVVACVTAMMFAWTSPLALALAALSVGRLVSGPPEPTTSEKGESDSGPRRAVMLVVAVGVASALAAVLVLGATGAAEYRWAAEVGSGSPDPATVVDLAVEAQEPSLASLAAQQVIIDTSAASSPNAAAVAAELSPVLERAAPWHVDSALTLLQLSSGAAGTPDAEAAEGALRAGELADPASGLWPYLSAKVAAAQGLMSEASAHAQRALTFDLPESARIEMEALAAP